MFDILIVEDNIPFRQILKGILTSQFSSLRIEESADGKTALSKIKGRPPQLVFMDIMLPGENGLQVTRKVKDLYPEILIVILTNHDSPEYRQAASQAGAEYFISKKSSSIKEIIDLVESLISGNVFPKAKREGYEDKGFTMTEDER
jgi:two-component system response regulator NreC